MDEKVAVNRVEHRRLDGNLLALQCELDEVPGPMPDPVPERLVRCHCEAVPGQDYVERREQVRRAVDERSIQIENEEGSRHRPRLSCRVSLGKTAGAETLGGAGGTC